MLADDEPWGSKVAAANSPTENIVKGVAQYVAAGVPASKLVIGLPWYGWDYPCDSGTPAPGCSVVPPAGSQWYGWATQVGHFSVLTLSLSLSLSLSLALPPSFPTSLYLSPFLSRKCVGACL